MENGDQAAYNRIVQLVVRLGDTGMEKTLRVLNALEAEGLIRRYAIGGAMAAVFYTEPVLTYDLDIFVDLAGAAGPIVQLTPLYEYLEGRGYKADHEHVVIEGVPVQFLPVFDLLTEEALAEARSIMVGETETRVLRAEHLMAIMLQTNRPKDRMRLVQFLENAQWDRRRWEELLMRHGLIEKWNEFR